MTDRLDRMHPINLTYFIWTFTRAEVVLPEFMNAVGGHLCSGILPMMDRCSLGTMVWNFAKQGVRHDEFFERAAAELSRPNRVRSLAPRNFQNVFIAYGRRKHWHSHLFRSLALGTQRLLDEHHPPGPKLARSLLFAYTCKDGSEVLADSWRISGLTVVLKTFRRMQVQGTRIEECVRSMADYVIRSVNHSPKKMRDPGDACSFALELAQMSMEIPPLKVDAAIEALRADLPKLLEGAQPGLQQKLQRILQKWSSRRTPQDSGAQDL